jgi:hypothetical protein
MNVRGRVLALATATVAVAASFSGSANASITGDARGRAPAHDTTGPNITMQSTAHLLTHSPVTYAYGSFSDDSQVYDAVVEARWSGSDPSGICDYQVWSDDGRSDPYQLADVGLATRYRFSAGDIDETNGGYHYTDLEIRAEDCAGNWSISGYVDTQPDSTEPATDRPLGLRDNSTYLATHDDSEGSYAAHAAWTHSTCSCFVGGTDIHAVTAGASASFSYTAETFGWISEYGPTRGSAKVYQDGKLRATVSLYAKTNTGPEVVWSNWFKTATPHTIKIVVVGTSGHPRVDVDGFFTGPTYP